MVLGENRGDRIARSSLGNRDGNLLASGDACLLPAKQALDGRNDKEGNGSKSKYGNNNADNHGHRRALLLGTATSMRVIARARGRSYAMCAVSMMCTRMRLRRLRTLRGRLPLKAGTACGPGCAGSGLLGRTLSRLCCTRGGLCGTSSRLSRTLRRLHRTLARRYRARRRLPLAIRLARIGSARHAKPPRFYDRAMSARTGWRRSCQSCPSSAFR